MISSAVNLVQSDLARQGVMCQGYWTDLPPEGRRHLHRQAAVLLQVGVQLSQNISSLHVGLR